MRTASISAERIECPGNWGDSIFSAVKLNVDGFKTPIVFTLALSVVGCRELAKITRPDDLYIELVRAINQSHVTVLVED